MKNNPSSSWNSTEGRTSGIQKSYNLDSGYCCAIAQQFRNDGEKRCHFEIPPKVEFRNDGENSCHPGIPPKAEYPGSRNHTTWIPDIVAPLRNNSGMTKFVFITLFTLIIQLFSQTAQAKPLTVMLDWFVNPDHAPLFVAQQEGFYKKFGLDVTFIPPADPSDPPKLVAAKKADIGVTYALQFKQEVAAGLPLKQIGTLIPMPLDCLVVLASSKIKTPADLKGKNIGYSSDASNHKMLRIMLKKYNLTLKDVHMINVHYNLAQALLSKKVDAITGAMRNFEPIEIQLAGQKTRVFYPEEYGMDPYSELILIANKDKANDPKIKVFLKALRLSTIYLINHPTSTWKTFAKNHPELNNEINKRAWFATIPRFALRPGV
ncbi:MAG: hypothetical protein A3H43_03950 [Gammaproteobacteria bacterium RIFCSPLOWO2_02_FULL_42_9]|nr:MAG: hypothetical protein A3H43_03950 [Gammaproteobacteria bacterium RIFCSPLOWO2_02_FULL_42_9]